VPCQGSALRKIKRPALLAYLRPLPAPSQHNLPRTASPPASLLDSTDNHPASWVLQGLSTWTPSTAALQDNSTWTLPLPMPLVLQDLSTWTPSAMAAPTTPPRRCLPPLSSGVAGPLNLDTLCRCAAGQFHLDAASWIPASELDPSSSLVKSYHRRYPHRPGP
jgi:hypothetical protein